VARLVLTTLSHPTTTKQSQVAPAAAVETAVIQQGQQVRLVWDLLVETATTQTQAAVVAEQERLEPME
jgi:hypothetical protein